MSSQQQDLPPQTPAHDAASHTHGAGVSLPSDTQAILERGLAVLLELTHGLAFRPPDALRYPLPLALAVYGDVPAPEQVRDKVRERMGTDPVSVLEDALVLLELHESNQHDAFEHVPDDAAFLGQTFRTKRSNGWIGLLGDADPAQVQEIVNVRQKFGFVLGRDRRTGVYALLRNDNKTTSVNEFLHKR